jgi:hypothetical protein
MREWWSQLERSIDDARKVIANHDKDASFHSVSASDPRP